MVEIVRSAVAEEIVKQIVSGILDKQGRKPNEKEHLERLEMAHIKLEAALETSNKWQIRDASLLRWRKKLKRAAQECETRCAGARSAPLLWTMKRSINGWRSGSARGHPCQRGSPFTKSLVSSILSGRNRSDDDRYG
jgi:hypothetical protein